MPNLQLHALALVLEAFAVDPTPVVEPTGERPHATTSEPNVDPARSPNPLPIRVDLDLSAVPAEDAEHFDPAIRAAINPLLARELVLRTAETPHQLVIHVALLDPATLDYGIDFVLKPGGRLIAAPMDRLYCRICAQVELVELVAQGLPQALSALRAAIESPPPRVDPAASVEVVEPPPVVAIEPPAAPSAHDPGPPPPRPRIRWLGPVGGLGIVLAVGGTSTVVLGTVALRRALSPDTQPAHLPGLEGDPQRWGWLLYGTGLAATAVGGVMLATDLIALRERRARRVTAHAAFTPSHRGLVVSGRF